MNRCFGTGIDIYEKYHDEEWGKPVYEDRKLWEMLVLETAQAGLNWITILRKRQGYADAFYQFDPHKAAQMSDAELDNLCHNPCIIRHRGKIYATRTNAQVFLCIQKTYGSFSHYLWNFVKNTPQQGHYPHMAALPSTTTESIGLAKDLRKKGMLFVGPTTMYAYMQAVGLYNDHCTSCFCYKY